MELSRVRGAPAAAWVWAVVAAVLWTVAEATHLESGWTIAAFIASMPLGPVVEVLLLVVFSVLTFDPTSSAPLWQSTISGAVVVFAMGACGFLNGLAATAIFQAVRARRATRRRDQ